MARTMAARIRDDTHTYIYSGRVRDQEEIQVQYFTDHMISNQDALPSKACSEGLLLARRSLGPPSATLDVEPARSTTLPLFPSHSPLVSSLLPDLQSSLPQSSTTPSPEHPPHYHTTHFCTSILPLQSTHYTRRNQHPPRAATRATPPCALRLPSTQRLVALSLPLRCP